jgi:hypothetical protein
MAKRRRGKEEFSLRCQRNVALQKLGFQISGNQNYETDVLSHPVSGTKYLV